MTKRGELKSSPTQKISFRGKEYFVKRDDLLDKHFSGNKARKFAYFLENPPLHVKKIVSFGSNQSNAMYSLSVLAKMLNLEFIYICNHLPKTLTNNPIGNFKNSLANNMHIKTHPNPRENAKTLCDDKALFIEEGGAIKEAQVGIKRLANEINEWTKGKNYDIFLPSGTGTTALFLQCSTHLQVYTCPCVGDKAYLKKQFLRLEKNDKLHPTILPPPKKYHFGKPKQELYKIWKELLHETKIEFDLLYDPIGWLTLLNYDFQNPLLYVHQGGILGNISMQKRYQYKNLI